MISLIRWPVKCNSSKYAKHLVFQGPYNINKPSYKEVKSRRNTGIGTQIFSNLNGQICGCILYCRWRTFINKGTFLFPWSIFFIFFFFFTILLRSFPWNVFFFPSFPIPHCLLTIIVENDLLVASWFSQSLSWGCVFGVFWNLCIKEYYFTNIHWFLLLYMKFPLQMYEPGHVIICFVQHYVAEIVFFYQF